jgi:thioredoxin 1
MAVLTITDNEFEQTLKDNPKVAVKYFADWCGSCKLFSPKFKRNSNDENNAGITFIEVNAEENPNARKAAGVNNLPFLAVFNNGELVEGLPTSSEEYFNEMLNKIR